MAIVLHNWNGFGIQQRQEDEFVCLTDMARACDRRVGDYLNLANTKEYIYALSLNKEIPIDQLVQVSNKGTWVDYEIFLDSLNWFHPGYLSKWMSMIKGKNWAFQIDFSTLPKETLLISEKIKRGIKASPFPYPLHNKEAGHRDCLAVLEAGQIEVKVPNGFIDVVTDTEIIEVKKITQWRKAFDQINRYAVYFPSKSKRVHLFGKSKVHEDSFIREQAKLLRIRVTFSNR